MDDPTATIPLVADADPPPATAPAEDLPPEVEGERRSRRWILPTVAIVLAVLALLLGGGVLGYQLADSQDRTVAPPAKVPPIGQDQEAGPSAEPEAQMPDVLRLSKEDALETLADLGIDTREVKFEERPFVGEPGRVVAQDPVRGTTDPGTITLTLSTAATVPDLAGKTQDEAEAAIEDLGGVPEIVEVYQADKPVGTVVTIDPAAGQPMAATVKVSISAAPGSIFIADLETIEGGCSAEAASVGSETSDQAMVCSADYLYADQAPDPAAAYDLAGRVDRFTAKVGVTNDNDPGTQARVRVLVDGQEKFNQVLEWGTPVDIDLPTIGAARLDIVVTAPTAEDDTWDSAYVAFLGPTFLGSRTAIDELDS